MVYSFVFNMFQILRQVADYPMEDCQILLTESFQQLVVDGGQEMTDLGLLDQALLGQGHILAPLVVRIRLNVNQLILLHTLEELASHRLGDFHFLCDFHHGNRPLLVVEEIGYYPSLGTG